MLSVYYFTVARIENFTSLQIKNDIIFCQLLIIWETIFPLASEMKTVCHSSAAPRLDSITPFPPEAVYYRHQRLSKRIHGYQTADMVYELLCPGRKARYTGQWASTSRFRVSERPHFLRQRLLSRTCSD